eukprot:6190319-Pleurochrysis_carterae.AAC.3
MQNGGPRPKSGGPQKRMTQKISPNEKIAFAALTWEGSSGEALRSPAASDRAILGKDKNLTSNDCVESNGVGLAM